MRTIRSAAPFDEGKWMCANFVTAWRIDSSMLPETSPPIVCASGRFMYVAASAVAIVSKRSPTVITTSGWSRSNAVGSSSSPSPVDFAIVPGVSPSISMKTRSSGSKPSRSITSITVPYRSSKAEAPTTSWSSVSGWSRIARIADLIEE